ncbi:MAG: hypothetical protein CMJ25_08730 [Phycisphaerae bacterium]|nr:hypothetical protein [Phycisphaerae bacterium]
MNQKTYQLLSTIYKILSDYKAIDIENACLYANVSPRIREILQLLYLESSHSSYPSSIEDYKKQISPEMLNAETPVAKKRQQDKVRKKKSKSKNSAAQEKHRTTKVLLQDDHDELCRLLVSYLSDKRRIPNKNALREFIHQQDLNVDVGPKDGLPRSIRLVAKQILSQDKYVDQIREIITSSSDKQMSGWLDLILQRGD